jgi:hypothetical protein
MGLVDDVDHAEPDPLTALRRWEDAGGTWRVVVRAPERLVVELLTCDAGEVMGRVVSAPPDQGLAAHVAAAEPDPRPDES